MFRKLISNVTFSPALIGQLGFYAKRLRKEEATRKFGLIFTALALIVQSFVVFSPPEPANAASDRDFIKGGVSSVEDFLRYYDKNDRNLKDMMTYIGITRSEIASAKKTNINSKDGWLSWGRTSPFSTSQGNVSHTYQKTGGGTGKMHSKPLNLWDSTSYTKKNGSTYVVFMGTSKKIGQFVIMAICGNAATKKLPPTPQPPKPPAPIATCTNLEVIRINDTQRSFKATAAVANGATISQYDFTIKDSPGKAIKTVPYKSSSTPVTSGAISFIPGQYSAEVVVTTSLGKKTSDSCTALFTIDKPGVTITKTVNNREQIKAELDQEFAYQITVKNTGQTALHNLEVTDTAPKKIVFISADKGTVTSTTWKHSLSSLEPGTSESFAIKAKATERAEPGATMIKNIACVETGDIPGSPDACDDALVEVPETQIKVCDLTTNKVVDIKKSDYNESRYSKNVNDCVKIQVCDTTSGTVVTIREPEFDKKTQTKDLTQCSDLQVCDLQSGEIIVIKRGQFDKQKHSEDAGDCIPAVTLTKSGLNLTQDNKDASKVTAKASDRIQYSLTVKNIGDITATAKFTEELEDVLEYAHIIDNGGGAFNSSAKTLTWPDSDLQPGESKTRMFVVQLASAIPAGARGISDPSSYDCTMTNSFGNTVDIAVVCPVEKTVEQTVAQLPTTGPAENMLFAGALLTIVTFFYARSRQLTKEVRLVRRDLNAGTI